MASLSNLIFNPSASIFFLKGLADRVCGAIWSRAM